MNFHATNLPFQSRNYNGLTFTDVGYIPVAYALRPTHLALQTHYWLCIWKKNIPVGLRKIFEKYLVIWCALSFSLTCPRGQLQPGTRVVKRVMLRITPYNNILTLTLPCDECVTLCWSLIGWNSFNNACKLLGHYKKTILDSFQCFISQVRTANGWNKTETKQFCF